MSTSARASLLRQLGWSVVLASLLAFIMQGVVLALWLRPLGEEVFTGVADMARQTRVALAAVPAAQREALARQLSVGRVRVQSAPVTLAEEAPWLAPPALARQARMLQAEGIELTLLDLASGADGLQLRMVIDGQPWWLVRTLQRPVPALISTLTVVLAMIALATALGLLWFVRHVGKPLAQMAEQLGALGPQLKPLPEARYTSKELHTVVLAFNHLVHQVAQQQQHRQQLLAGVSHDLRTPLARLRLRVETQCEEALAGRLSADLQALEHIVNQFLAYVQGDVETPRGPTRPLVESVSETVAPYLGQAQAVREDLAPLQQAVMHTPIQRLLANLIDNALDHGRAPVTVVLKAVGDDAELQVWDQGQGMTPQMFELALQPFVRLGRQSSDAGHCGLGLAIAAQMARQLGGHLQTAHDATLGFGIVLRLPGAGSPRVM